jgi:glutathione synthase/RimK-type ligase-like ATP-grasp enzyme
VGNSQLEQIPCTEKYQIWADKAAEFFGGLDILSVDAIYCRNTNQEKIMEINGTSSGLSPECADEDNKHIRDLVMQKMNAVLCHK